LRVFKYVQSNANLSGMEIIVDVHPHVFHWLHFENSFSFVQALQKGGADSTKYLPFIPAPKCSLELKTELEKPRKNFKNSYFSIGLDNYFSQDKIYSAYNTETATSAYTLIRLGVGTEVYSKSKTLFSLFVSVNNLTDVGYQSHLSRLKYVGENYFTGRKGIYDMGRNISFKLLAPFTLKKGN